MHRFGLVLAVSGLAASAAAQVLVGRHGSGLLTFDVAPPVEEWATQSFGGDNGGGGIVDAAGLDEQVQAYRWPWWTAPWLRRNSCHLARAGVGATLLAAIQGAAATIRN